MHHSERVFRNDALARCGHAAAGEGVNEFCIVGDRGDESRAAAFVLAAEDVHIRHRRLFGNAAFVVEAVLRCHSRLDRIGHDEGRIDHSAGLEDVLFHVFAESHTRHDLDSRRENVVAEAVLEAVAGVEIEGHFCDRGDRLAGGTASARAVGDVLNIGGGEVVVESRRHRKQVAEGDGTLRGDCVGSVLDADVGKFGKHVRDGIAHKEFALLEKLKRRDAGHDLRAGIHIVKLVAAQGLACPVTVKLFVVTVNDNVRRGNAVGGEGVDEVCEIGEVHFDFSVWG